MSTYEVHEVRDAEGRRAYALARPGHSAEPAAQLYYSKRAAREVAAEFTRLEAETEAEGNETT